MAAKVIHFEVVGKDGGALQKFYSEVFDWKIDTNNPGGYGMVAPEADSPAVSGPRRTVRPGT